MHASRVLVDQRNTTYHACNGLHRGLGVGAITRMPKIIIYFFICRPRKTPTTTIACLSITFNQQYWKLPKNKREEAKALRFFYNRGRRKGRNKKRENEIMDLSPIFRFGRVQSTSDPWEQVNSYTDESAIFATKLPRTHAHVQQRISLDGWRSIDRSINRFAIISTEDGLEESIDVEELIVIQAAATTGRQVD